MNANLKLLADASLEVSAAEEALEEGAFRTARDRLDAAGSVLEELRAAWAAMAPPERGVVGPAAKDVRERLDAATTRVPRFRSVSQAEAVEDPDHEHLTVE